MPQFSQLLRLTDGERRLAIALMCMALFGAAVGLVVAVRIGHGGVVTEGFGLYDLWVILSGAMGGAAGLWFMRHRMGQPGLRGLGLACTGVGAISLLGPLIGGTLALPLYGTMFGPFTLAVIFASAPMLGVLWLCFLAMVHVLMLDWTAERDSIFRSLDAAVAAPPRRRKPAAVSLRPGSSG